MTLPSRKSWVALKKQHEISDGAVGGVSIGPLIDKVRAASTVPAQITALKAFEKAGVTYLSKLDKKKVKDYAKFEKIFLDEYLGDANKTLKNHALAADKAALMASELRRFFTAAQAVAPAKATAADVKGLVHRGRGVSSAMLRASGVADYTKMQKMLTAIDNLPDASDLKTPEGVRAAATKLLKMINAVAEEAKAKKLL